MNSKQSENIIVPAASGVIADSSNTTASGVVGPMEIIGVYVDSTTYPGMSPEIILYKQDNKLEGTYSSGFSNPESKKGLFWGPSPLENILLGHYGSLVFIVPWSQGNQQLGFVKKRDIFEGQLINDTVQGAIVDEYGFIKTRIKATKKTSEDLKQDIFEYVLKAKRSASENIHELDMVLACQYRRNQLPKEAIEVIGRWLKVEGNGEHEWGYDVILFKLGGELHGWLEDYSGLVGDGGIRYLISDIRLNNEKLHFKTYGKAEYDGIVKKSQLELNSFGNITRLEKLELPTVDWVWKQYQALNVKCE